jgi:hypothetical protein
MKNAIATLWASFARTVVPIIAGWIITQLVNIGIPVDDEFGGAINSLLVVVFSAVYYLLVRIFETYISPRFGWLLGYAKAPATYIATATPLAKLDNTTVASRATSEIKSSKAA